MEKSFAVLCAAVAIVTAPVVMAEESKLDRRKVLAQIEEWRAIETARIEPELNKYRQELIALPRRRDTVPRRNELTSAIKEGETRLKKLKDKGYLPTPELNLHGLLIGDFGTIPANPSAFNPEDNAFEIVLTDKDLGLLPEANAQRKGQTVAANHFYLEYSFHWKNAGAGRTVLAGTTKKWVSSKEYFLFDFPSERLPDLPTEDIIVAGGVGKAARVIDVVRFEGVFVVRGKLVFPSDVAGFKKGDVAYMLERWDLDAFLRSTAVKGK